MSLSWVFLKVEQIKLREQGISIFCYILKFKYPEKRDRRRNNPSLININQSRTQSHDARLKQKLRGKTINYISYKKLGLLFL